MNGNALTDPATENDTSKIFQFVGANNTETPGQLTFLNPTFFDLYQNGNNQQKQDFLRDERVAIGIEVDQTGTKIDKVITEITYHYPSYPVEGYVTVTYTDRGESDLDPGAAETCGVTTESAGPEFNSVYAARTNLMERHDYDSCPMLRYNGDTTVIVRAYSGGTPLQSITTTIRTSGWKQR